MAQEVCADDARQHQQCHCRRGSDQHRSTPPASCRGRLHRHRDLHWRGDLPGGAVRRVTGHGLVRTDSGLTRQCGREFRTARVAASRVLGQHSGDGGVEIGEVGPPRAEMWRRRGKMLGDHHCGVGVVVGCRAGQQVKCGAAQRVLVGTPVDVVAQELFGCGVSRRPHHHVGGGQTADVTDLPGNTEVGQQDPAPARVGITEQNVGGLDVAVQQSALMRIVQRVGDGTDDREGLGPRHSGLVAAAQQFGGVGPLDVIHRQPQLTFEFAAVVDADDVGMPQLGGDVRFPAESLPELEVRGQRGW